MVRVLDKYKLEYEARNINSDRGAYEEMVQKSKQYSSPCVEINGHMLADVGGDEVETWMRQQGLLQEEAA